MHFSRQGIGQSVNDLEESVFVLGFEFKFNESFKPMKERSLKVELLLVFRF